MFPPSAHHQNLSKQLSYYGGDGGGGGGFLGVSSEGIFGFRNFLEGGYDCSSEAAYHLGRSDLFFCPTIMAEDESRNESVNEAESSSSKDNNVMIIQDQENKGNNTYNSNEDWLQLSIGGRSTSHEKQYHQQRDELVELNLLPGSSSSSEQRERLLTQRYHSAAAATVATPEFQMQSRPRPPLAHYGFDTSLYLQHQAGTNSSFLPAPQTHPQEINWVYRPMTFPRPQPLGITSLSPSSSFVLPPGAYFSSARPPFQAGPASIPSMSSGGPDVNFRVINPPRRPHSGIWFMLQASQNQAKEPFLPQIPKSYLRIKDRRMTIRLVKKYLVNKLRLENESE